MKTGDHRARLVPPVLVALAALCLWEAPAPAGESAFRRGDGNNDGLYDISDAVYVLRNLFLGDASAGCDDAADADDDGALSITDGIYTFRYLFVDGPPPPPPFEACGPDPTEDDPFGCETSASCPGFSGDCLTQEALGGLLQEIPGFSFCLPAGVIAFQFEGLEVNVCPAEGAAPCGAAQIAGCPVEITGIAPALDVAGRRLVLAFEGRVAGLPVQLRETIFGTTANCTVDLGGSAAGSPFRFEATVPLAGTEVAPGVFQISGTGAVSVEAVDARLAVAGGLLCRLFQLGEQAFIALLASQLQAAAQAIADAAGPQLAGLYLCE